VKEYKEERAARRQAESEVYQRTQRVEESKVEKERLYNRLGRGTSSATLSTSSAPVRAASESSSASSSDEE
jgi:hypothetical protein